MAKWVGRILFWMGRAFHVLFSQGPSCRFHPTCTDYAQKALEIHGIWKGTFLVFRRLFRCHPFGGSGWDPVPES